jgi:hypothetical protein
MIAVDLSGISGISSSIEVAIFLDALVAQGTPSCGDLLAQHPDAPLVCT